MYIHIHIHTHLYVHLCTPTHIIPLLHGYAALPLRHGALMLQPAQVCVCERLVVGGKGVEEEGAGAGTKRERVHVMVCPCTVQVNIVETWGGGGRDPKKQTDFCTKIQKQNFMSVGRRHLLQNYWYKVPVLHIVKYHT